MSNGSKALIAWAFVLVAGAVYLFWGTLFESSNVKNAKAQLGKFLFDPYSAQYEDVREIKTEIGAMVCGLVNAKNRMGAYVGRKPFYYTSINEEVVVISNNSDAFVYSSFSKYCF